MSDILPAAGYIPDLARTVSQERTALENVRTAVFQIFGRHTKTTLTLATDAIVPDRVFHKVDTEAAAAADNLKNITDTNVPDGAVVILEAVDPSRVVTVKHLGGGAGQISLLGAADVSLNSLGRLFLEYNLSSTTWFEVWRIPSTTGTAVSVLGVTGNADATRADIVAGANDRLLARVSNAIAFVQLTAGMIPNSILTYAMLASAAIATASEYLSNTASKILTPAAVWSAAAPVAFTDASPITLDLNAGINFAGTLNVVGSTRQLANFTNAKPGQSGNIYVTQDGTGSRLLTYGTAFKFAGGSAPTLTTTAGATDRLTYFVRATTPSLVIDLDISKNRA